MKNNVTTIIIRTDYDNKHKHYYENDKGTVIAVGQQPTNEIVKQVKVLANLNLTLKEVRKLLEQAIEKLDTETERKKKYQ